MITLYKGKKVEVTGEFLLPRAIVFGIMYEQTYFAVALGVIGFEISWSGEGDDD